MGTIKASAETIKLIIAVAVGALLLFAGNKVLEWKAGAEQNESRGRTMEATSGITADGAKADADRGKTDAGLSAGRDTFNNATEEDRRNEPETAARDDRGVPASRLRAFRERRLARERLGCAGEQCESRSEAAPAPQR